MELLYHIMPEGNNPKGRNGALEARKSAHQHQYIYHQVVVGHLRQFECHRVQPNHRRDSDQRLQLYWHLVMDSSSYM